MYIQMFKPLWNLKSINFKHEQICKHQQIWCDNNKIDTSKLSMHICTCRQPPWPWQTGAESWRRRCEAGFVLRTGKNIVCKVVERIFHT